MGAAGWLLTSVPALCGFLLWPWIAPPPRGTGERVGYGVCAGVVLVVTGMLLSIHLADRFTLAGLLVPLGVLGLGALAAARRRAAPGVALPDAPPGWPGRLALVVILGEIGLVLREIAVNPSLSDWDAWAIWGVKAKAFFVDHGVARYLGRADFYDFSWPARPCLSSLFQAFAYTCLGRVDEVGARLVHVVLTCSLLLIFHGSVRRRYGADSALVWTAVLATVPNLTYQASAGLANMVLGLFLFATLAALEAWESDPCPAHLVGPSLLLGGAFLARDEGLVLGGLTALCAFGIVRRSERRWRDSLWPGLAVVLAAGALYGLWYSLVLPHSIWDIRSMWFEADVFPRLLRHRHEVPAILLGVGRELARPVEQTRTSPLEDALGVSLFWPLFGLAGLVLIRRRRSDVMGLRCAVVAAGGLSIYTLGLILFPYQDLADVMNNWLFVLDRHALALAAMAARAAAAAFSVDPEAEAGSGLSISPPPEERSAPARS